MESNDRSGVHSSLANSITIKIEPCSAKALPLVRQGQQVKVVDIKGGQVADFIVFNSHDPRERLSQSHTIVFNGQKLELRKGCSLYSTEQNKMMTIIEDTCERHDIIHPPCSRKILRDYLLDGDRNGCEESLKQEMQRQGIDTALLPCPFNIFQNTVLDGYQVLVEPPISKPGDFVILRADMDCIVIVSSCAISSYGSKPIQVEIM
jgi:uncharacterized protein YcgI (DUF1989 family)